MPTPKLSREEALLRYSIWCRCKGSTKQSVPAYKEETGKEISEDTMRRGVRMAREILGIKTDNFVEGPDLPDGYKVKGTSTLYDSQTGEPKIQWVKTEADKARQDHLFREAISALAADLPRLKPISAPAGCDNHRLACFPVGDHHFGMKAWHEEAGENYDLKIAEGLLVGAINYLLDTMPKCGDALIAFLGDLFHYDGIEPVTPTNKNLLDSDGRYSEMIRVVLRCVRYMIELTAARYGRVRIIIEPGNHDLSTSVFLMECLANLYEDNPRISIDTSPAHFHYFRFGKCLIGTHHGHGVKLDRLPMVMATDRPGDWGETAYRYWFTGHIHHDSTKDFPGCRVESLRVLSPNDAYAANKGYRSPRDMKAILFDAEHGEIARHTVNPDMLRQ